MRDEIFAPTNYDPKREQRGRRALEPIQENKAVYTFKVKDLLSSDCRINGRVGAFMPTDRSIDIDTLESFT